MDPGLYMKLYLGISRKIQVLDLLNKRVWGECWKFDFAPFPDIS